MNITPEVIAVIEQIDDARLSALGLQKAAPALRRYHTIPEIRLLITENMPSLIGWFGDDDFDIAVLRHFLSRKTTLRDGDLEIPNPDHQNMTRWDAQVLNAINPTNWPECPIVQSSKRRHYRLNPATQLSL